ncbi:hypothetical protein HYY75_04700 [bacterium]|nr:hypothetical protein [bacterium]
MIFRNGFIFFCILIFSSIFNGCSSNNNQEITKLNDPSLIPSGKEKLFRLTGGNSPKIQVKRNGKIFEFAARLNEAFFSQDELRNLSPEVIKLNSTHDEFFFSLRNGTRVIFALGSLTVFEGSLQMEFRKVDGVFKVKIPGAILGIRGTRFDLDVSPEKSIVVLHEGKISIESTGKEVSLNQGETVSISPDGSHIDVKQSSEPTNNLPDVFRKLPPEKLKESIR